MGCSAPLLVTDRPLAGASAHKITGAERRALRTQVPPCRDEAASAGPFVWILAACLRSRGEPSTIGPVPLTAVHRDHGALDATLDDLGGAATWEQVHRVRPRAPITCRGCGHGVQAKVSKLGLRFFADDAAVAECPANGETPAHRLLKSELAAAIRAAGWVAELEVPGDGWRADVLAISPDGESKIAWEAQLASATVDDLRERTATMLAELDGVCWVTDKDVPWVARVPSVRVRRDDETNTLTVVDGIGRFEPEWCKRRHHCDIWAQHGFYDRPAEPCAGHGEWHVPANFTLAALVVSVCTNKLVVHETRARRRDLEFRHPGGTTIWTAGTYIEKETKQVEATAVEDRRDRVRSAKAAAEGEEHERRIEALLARQTALIKPTVVLVHRDTGTYPTVYDGPRESEWAMGVPVRVNGRTYAVICPVASRIDARLRRRFASLLLVVAEERERARVAKACEPRQRIVVIKAPSPASTPSQASGAARGISVQQAVRRLVWGS